MTPSGDPVYRDVESNTMLSILAVILLVGGIIACILLVGAAGTIHNTSSYQDWGDVRVDPLLIAAAVGTLFQGVVGYAALKGLADAISILKYVGRQVDPAIRNSNLEQLASTSASDRPGEAGVQTVPAMPVTQRDMLRSSEGKSDTFAGVVIAVLTVLFVAGFVVYAWL